MSPLLILALFVPWQTRPPEKCSLSGTVVSSITGEPLNKVDLRLEPLDKRATHVAVTRSDANGHFALVEIDPGSYHLTGQRNSYLEMSYGARKPQGEGSVLRLETGQSLDGLTYKLTPAAAVAGTIRDSDGEPLEDAHVTLARFTYESGGRRLEGYDSTDTDDRGEYRFRGLAAGKYYVGVEPKSQGWDRVDHSAKAGPTEVGVPTLYPGVTDMALAVPIEVPAGKTVTSIDLTLVRSHVVRVSGRVVHASAADRLAVVLHDAKNAAIRDTNLRTSTKNAAGDFEFREVPPGSYDVTAGEGSQSGKTAIVVGTADVEGVRVTLASGADIKFHVAKEGSDKPVTAGLNFFITINGREGFSPWPLNADKLTISNVPPDHYLVKIDGSALRDSYIKTARAGDTDVLENGLAVTGPGTVGIEVVLAADGAMAQGIVRDKDQQPVAGATILLAPDNRLRADLFRSTTSDQNGRYEFTAVAPGNYKLFAWDDVEPHAWNDPDFLKDYEKLSEKVSLDAGTKTAVELHLAIR